jgi:hypothetical protein
MKITRVLAAFIATFICAALVVVLYLIFEDGFVRLVSTIVMFWLFLILGLWTGIFLLLKPNGFTPEDKIDVDGKDADLE